MTVYYNEFDPFAAAWLRELIKAGHIADGVVDERSIEDVCPSDLRGFTQCHFFAGIGVWSYALRRAGWGDDRPVWTGSCPCQPFSSAGAGAGFADERHLWPAFFHLIQECKPALVFGEQVASKDANAWLDLVHTDMEALGFSFGAVAFPSAGVGAPHIRDRTYWVANANCERFDGFDALLRSRAVDSSEITGSSKTGWMADASDERQHGRRASQTSNGRDAAWVEPERLCDGGRMADAHGKRLDGINTSIWIGQVGDAEAERCGETRNNKSELVGGVFRVSERSVGLADTEHDGCGGSQGRPTEPRGDQQNLGVSDRGHSISQGQPPTGPTNGFWADADWLFCRDGKWRPVEPGTFPLAHGAAARVGRLRGYGNAINAVAAQAFIESVMEAA
jgi:DNA (cytosine-5)-methyltransferase 1